MSAPPTERATLVRFYELVRPSGPGWAAVRAESGQQPAPDSLAHGMLGWLCGCSFVYSALFGTGSLLYGNTPQFFAWFAVFAISGVGMWRVLRGFWIEVK
jgi:SSS family solute:Na+ symporter